MSKCMVRSQIFVAGRDIIGNRGSETIQDTTYRWRFPSRRIRALLSILVPQSSVQAELAHVGLFSVPQNGLARTRRSHHAQGSEHKSIGEFVCYEAGGAIVACGSPNLRKETQILRLAHLVH